MTKKEKGKTLVSETPKVVRTPMSKEQELLVEFVGHKERTWGTGNNLPRLNKSLSSGNGLLKTGSGDQTSNMFGFKRRRII